MKLYGVVGVWNVVWLVLTVCNDCHVYNFSNRASMSPWVVLGECTDCGKAALEIDLSELEVGRCHTVQYTHLCRSVTSEVYSVPYSTADLLCLNKYNLSMCELRSISKLHNQQ